MKLALKIFFFLVSLSQIVGQSTPKVTTQPEERKIVRSTSLSRDDEVRLVVFRELLKRWKSKSDQLKYFYLAVDGAPNDPSDLLLSGLRREWPNVKPDSECTFADDSTVVDVVTGERGVRFSVSKINWISEIEAKLSGDDYVGNLGVFGCDYHVKKIDAKWKIVSSEKCYIS